MQCNQVMMCDKLEEQEDVITTKHFCTIRGAIDEMLPHGRIGW